MGKEEEFPLLSFRPIEKERKRKRKRRKKKKRKKEKKDREEKKKETEEKERKKRDDHSLTKIPPKLSLSGTKFRQLASPLFTCFLKLPFYIGTFSPARSQKLFLPNLKGTKTRFSVEEGWHGCQLLCECRTTTISI